MNRNPLPATIGLAKIHWLPSGRKLRNDCRRNRVLSRSAFWCKRRRETVALGGEKCSALPEGMTRWSVAGSSLRGVCSLLQLCLSGTVQPPFNSQQCVELGQTNRGAARRITEVATHVITNRIETGVKHRTKGLTPRFRSLNGS